VICRSPLSAWQQPAAGSSPIRPDILVFSSLALPVTLCLVPLGPFEADLRTHRVAESETHHAIAAPPFNRSAGRPPFMDESLHRRFHNVWSSDASRLTGIGGSTGSILGQGPPARFPFSCVRTSGVRTK